MYSSRNSRTEIKIHKKISAICVFAYICVYVLETIEIQKIIFNIHLKRIASAGLCAYNHVIISNDNLRATLVDERYKTRNAESIAQQSQINQCCQNQRCQTFQCIFFEDLLGFPLNVTKVFRLYSVRFPSALAVVVKFCNFFVIRWK